MPDAAQDFGYATTGSGGGTFGSGFSLDNDADGTLPASRTFTFTGADATGTKTITESAVAGWTLTNLVCTGGGANTSTAGAVATIGLNPGEAVTCTYTNTQNASLDIEKPSVGGTATFDYAVGGSGLAATSPANTAVANPTTNAPFPFTGFQLGTKDVQETPEPGWTLTNIVCTPNGAEITIGTGIGGTFAQGATAGFDPGDTTVRAVITAGDTPTCTYTNTADATLAIHKTTRGRRRHIRLRRRRRGRPGRSGHHHRGWRGLLRRQPHHLRPGPVRHEDRDRDGACRLDADGHRLHR